MSGTLSPEILRSGTAQKLASEGTINVFSDIMEIAGLPFAARRRRRPPLKRRPSLAKRLEKMKRGLDKLMAELDEAVKKSMKDNDGEKRIQKSLAVSLFIVGLAVVTIGVFQNQLVIAAIGAVPELLIIWPYRNLTKIKNENTFLHSLVPWVKASMMPCELLVKQKEIEDCYKDGLKKLDEWMAKLRRSAYSR